jgi:nitrogen fixation protein FixH
MKITRLISEYRWPIYLAGLLTMPVIASAVIVYVATRPDTPRPIKGYYESAQAWDADEAVEQASAQLGWTVQFELPADVPHFTGMPRPIDVRVADRTGKPVTGLTGRFFAIRPSDTRLNQTTPVTAVPQEPGRYRTIVLMDAPGAWDVRLDLTMGPTRFVHAARLAVPAAAEGAAR